MKWMIRFLIITCMSASSYASSLTSWWQNKTWKPIIGIGGGFSSPTNSGQSQNFPIKNSLTDEFYDYSANHTNQISGLFDGFIGIEQKLGSSWLVQAGLDYTQASPFSAKGTLTQGVDAASEDFYTYHYQIITRQLLVTTKWLYQFKKCLLPYLFVGIGPSFNKAYDYDTNVPVDLAFTRQYSSHTTSAFSYALGLGFDANINSHIRLGIEYRFADLGKVQLGSAMIDTTSVSGTLSQSNFYTNELLARLTYIFN